MVWKHKEVLEWGWMSKLSWPFQSLSRDMGYADKLDPEGINKERLSVL